MPIRKNVLTMEPAELQKFVAERRTARSMKIYAMVAIPAAKRTVANVARTLGVKTSAVEAELEKLK
jgi:hypothetical protein